MSPLSARRLGRSRRADFRRFRILGCSICPSAMQNRYVADVGDFGKFALLNALTGTDLRLGVMWYLNSVEESNADGGFTAYPNLRQCDPGLYEKLARILKHSKRNLSEIETRGILPPKTIFYRESLPFPDRGCVTGPVRAQQQGCRERWFKNGFKKVRPADLVFLDPDNGVAGKRVKKYSRKSVKYVFVDEITDSLNRHQSVVLYQHQRREPLQGQILQQLQEFSEYGSSGWALSFHRQSVRIYFVLPSPEHREQLKKRTTAFVESRWGREGHFRLRMVNPA
jgi:hypothetical protein